MKGREKRAAGHGHRKEEQGVGVRGPASQPEGRSVFCAVRCLQSCGWEPEVPAQESCTPHTFFRAASDSVRLATSVSR